MCNTIKPSLRWLSIITATIFVLTCKLTSNLYNPSLGAVKAKSTVETLQSFGWWTEVESAAASHYAKVASLLV